MKTHLHLFAAAAVIAACLTAASSPAFAAAAPIRICTFPGSPSAMLDKAVAMQVFKAAGVSAVLVDRGIAGRDDDDGISLRELRKSLGHRCDVIAGFPRSRVADGSGAAMVFSRGYLRAEYVSVEANAKPHEGAGTVGKVIAATYGSPSQLIAVQEPHAHFDLENTPEQTVDAVASGRAMRAIVWYPAVVAYRHAHGGEHFEIRKTRSPYTDWQLVFAFDRSATPLQRKIDGALGAMAADGRLDALTRDWALPASVSVAQTQAAKPASVAYRDGSFAPARRSALFDAAYSARSVGRIVKISAAAASASPSPSSSPSSSSSSSPSFNQAQVAHGKSLYASACAKCHGANMQGVTAPALSGPAFAPASGSHLTIGGIYTYMSTNMPADRPGKLKDDEYADIMAYLLSANGYAPGNAKMTADGARSSTTKLNAGPLGVGTTAAK